MSTGKSLFFFSFFEWPFYTEVKLYLKFRKFFLDEKNIEFHLIKSCIKKPVIFMGTTEAEQDCASA